MGTFKGDASIFSSTYMHPQKKVVNRAHQGSQMVPSMKIDKVSTMLEKIRSHFTTLKKSYVPYGYLLIVDNR